MATKTGELLFGKTLDFAWCHLAIQAHRLQEIIPRIQRRDLSFFAEFTLALKDEVQMREADWLSWEDPFILSRDPTQLKAEREQSLSETRKRLAYVIPILQLLYAASDGLTGAGWEEQFKLMAEQGDDQLLDATFPNSWDEAEWEW